MTEAQLRGSSSSSISSPCKGKSSKAPLALVKEALHAVFKGRQRTDLAASIQKGSRFRCRKSSSFWAVLTRRSKGQRLQGREARQELGGRCLLLGHLPSVPGPSYGSHGLLLGFWAPPLEVMKLLVGDLRAACSKQRSASEVPPKETCCRLQNSTSTAGAPIPTSLHHGCWACFLTSSWSSSSWEVGAHHSKAPLPSAETPN